MDIKKKDKEILIKLAENYAEIASLSVHNDTINNWKKLNSLKPIKPMFGISQLPWHELNINDELTLRCENELFRNVELSMRHIIYAWEHFPCDMVVMPYIQMPKIISDTGYGISIKYDDPEIHDIKTKAQTHIFADQISNEEALEKLSQPIIGYDEKTTMINKNIISDILGDVLEVRLSGMTPGFAVWDLITFFRGITPILYDIYDRPEFLHAIMKKFTDFKINALKQYEKLNILDKDVLTIHCSGTHTNELPAEDFDGIHVRGKDCWASGMAQVFSSSSKEMFDEFEIQYASKYYEYCGLVNYGCCEPLHDKIDLIRKMKNIRKISASPWADVDIMARNIGKDYVLLRKPNPAFVAGDDIDEKSIRAEIRGTLNACYENDTPCEFVLKDITTVNNKPDRLTKWAMIVKDEIEKSKI